LELPLKTVQGRLGHSSIQMTADVYGHLFPSGDDAAELRRRRARLPDGEMSAGASKERASVLEGKARLHLRRGARCRNALAHVTTGVMRKNWPSLRFIHRRG
jgi:hypothetical protein